MKLMVVTAIKECRRDIAEIFVKNEVEIYSLIEIYGIHNKEKHSHFDNWFGRNWEETHESIMLFSFAKEETAKNTLAAIKKYNNKTNSQFPIKAIVSPVEMAVGFDRSTRP